MIPRVIHTIWVGGPVPDQLAAWRQTWIDLHPGWEHRLWTGFDWLTNQDLYDNAEQHTSSVGQFRADIARYEILRRHGGVYVDMDFECRKPLDDLLDGIDCFAAREDRRWINNAILGAVPGHPLFTDLIVGLPGNVAQHQGKRPNVMTGPQFLTPIARRRPMTVFPSAWFYPYRWDELHRGGEVFPDAYAVHHWWNQRSKTRG